MAVQRNQSEIAGIARRTLRQPLLLIAAAAAVLTWAACSSILGPSGPCDERFDVKVCVGQEAYRPLDTLVFTVENHRDETVFHDGCARQIATRLDPDIPFSEVFDHRGHCGFEPPEEVIQAHTKEIPPGGTVTDSAFIPGGFPQVQARVHVWLVDADGEPLFPRPAVSGEFDIFRGAF